MKHVDFDKSQIKLGWSFTQELNRLQISYQIENLSGADIYVLDVMFRLVGGPILDSRLAYTIIENDLLTLFRGVLPIPGNLQVEAPDVPFARLLKAGGKIRGIIDPPLPLAFHNPYAWNDNEELRVSRHLRLRIGYLLAKDLNPTPQMKMVDGVEVFYPRYRQAIDIQRVLETPAKKATVEILVKP